MEKNEIKKELYKQSPDAKLSFIRKGVAYYTAALRDHSQVVPESRNISFEIPVIDMGDADFNSVMEAKYLIRWLV